MNKMILTLSELKTTVNKSSSTLVVDFILLNIVTFPYISGVSLEFSMGLLVYD